MPWVRTHRRRLPYSWLRSTTVSSHYRRAPGSVPLVVIAAVILVILLIIWLT